MSDQEFIDFVESKDQKKISLAWEYLNSFKSDLLFDIKTTLRGCFKNDIEKQSIQSYEDLIFDTCVMKVFDRFRLKKGEWKGGSIKSYLRKACVNLSVDFYRQGSTVLQYKPPPKTLISNEDRKELLISLLRTISFKCTVILWLRNMGYSHKKIGEIMGYTINTSKTYKRNCSNKLLDALDNDEGLKKINIRGLFFNSN